MSYEDEMADLRSDVKNKLLEKDLTNAIYHSAYWEWKKLYKEYVLRYWKYNEEYFHTADEATNHMLLDDILAFDFDDGGLTDVEKFAEILKIDADLFEYCNLQVGDDGVFGMLKYKTPLAKKTGFIKQAVALVK